MNDYPHLTKKENEQFGRITNGMKASARRTAKLRSGYNRTARRL